MLPFLTSLDEVGPKPSSRRSECKQLSPSRHMSSKRTSGPEQFPLARDSRQTGWKRKGRLTSLVVSWRFLASNLALVGGVNFRFADDRKLSRGGSKRPTHNP